MFTLYIFGHTLEVDLLPDFFHANAPWIYLILYFGAIIVSSVPAYEKHKNNPAYCAVGASGAIYAVLFSYIIINPTAMLQIMFLPIPMPAFVLGILYLVYEWYMSKRGRTNIGHDAHLWGGIFGIVFTISLHHEFIQRFYYQIVALFTS
jgi:membrane associated rhomboid family serine protease